MRFITHDGEKITGVYCGDPGTVSQPTTAVPETFQGRTGMLLASLDEQWKLRPMSDLLRDELIEKPEGFEWDDAEGDWRPATDAELIADGRKKLGKREKLENDFVVEKSMEELDAEGLLTEEERTSWRREKALRRLREIDTESIRPLRAILVGAKAQEDRDKLAALEAEAKTLRKRLK